MPPNTYATRNGGTHAMPRQATPQELDDYNRLRRLHGRAPLPRGRRYARSFTATHEAYAGLGTLATTFGYRNVSTFLEALGLGDYTVAPTQPASATPEPATHA